MMLKQEKKLKKIQNKGTSQASRAPSFSTRSSHMQHRPPAFGFTGRWGPILVASYGRALLMSYLHKII